MSDDEPIDEVVERLEIPGFATLEEAIAAAMDGLDDGDIVSIHAEDCELREDSDNEEDCTCTPIILTLGPKA